MLQVTEKQSGVIVTDFSYTTFLSDPKPNMTIFMTNANTSDIHAQGGKTSHTEDCFIMKSD